MEIQFTEPSKKGATIIFHNIIKFNPLWSNAREGEGRERSREDEDVLKGRANYRDGREKIGRKTPVQVQSIKISVETMT